MDRLSPEERLKAGRELRVSEAYKGDGILLTMDPHSPVSSSPPFSCSRPPPSSDADDNVTYGFL